MQIRRRLHRVLPAAKFQVIRTLENKPNLRIRHVHVSIKCENLSFNMAIYIPLKSCFNSQVLSRKDKSSNC